MRRELLEHQQLRRGGTSVAELHDGESLLSSHSCFGLGVVMEVFWWSKAEGGILQQTDVDYDTDHLQPGCFHRRHRMRLHRYLPEWYVQVQTSFLWFQCSHQPQHTLNALTGMRLVLLHSCTVLTPP